MIRRLTLGCIGSLMAAGLLALPAHAFTFENGNPGPTSIPKFDLEEQARQFRTPQVDTSLTPKKEFDTPLGKLQFGVQERSSMFGYGSPFAPTFGPNGGAADRRHYDRMFTPDYLQGGGRGP